MESTDEASGGRSVQTILLLCLSLCLSLVSARLPACPPARLPVCLPARLAACLAVCLSARPPGCLSVCLSYCAALSTLSVLCVASNDRKFSWLFPTQSHSLQFRTDWWIDCSDSTPQRRRKGSDRTMDQLERRRDSGSPSFAPVGGNRRLASAGRWRKSRQPRPGTALPWLSKGMNGSGCCWASRRAPSWRALSTQWSTRLRGRGAGALSHPRQGALRWPSWHHARHPASASAADACRVRSPRRNIHPT
jgi:hypothetical protein